jgi:STE24 endopeptidase
MVNLELPWEPLYTQGAGEVSGIDTTSAYYYYALVCTVAFTLAVHTFEAYLDFRQRSQYKLSQPSDFPQELEKTVSQIDEERKQETKKEEGKSEDDSANKDGESKTGETDKSKPLLPQLKEKFRSAQAYGLDKVNFGMIASTFDVLYELACLILGFLPWIWDESVEWGAKLGWTEADNEIKISLIFLLLTTIIGTLTSLPFELYSTFEIERKHGFNKQTLGLFFSDKVKGLVLTIAIGGPFLALLLYIIKVRSFWFLRHESLSVMAN